MRHALALGRRQLGRVWPNPAVGCVLVKEGRIIARGMTQSTGRPHAETLALSAAGENARGAVAYVTLEPCAHVGQTPPCALSLISAGVARVVTALTDPDRRVAGKGHAMLQKAGILVNQNVLSDQARQDHAGFLKRVTQGLPFVTLKMAQSLDGRAALASGESRWITGFQARRHVHGLRLSHDAVLVGAGTARIDNPDLQVRDMGVLTQPLRLIIDPMLSLPVGSRLGQSASPLAPVWLLHSHSAPEEALKAWERDGVRLLACNSVDGRIDLRLALAKLAQLGLTRILCEGGPRLASALVAAGLVDQIICFNAGILFGSDSQASFGSLDLSALSQAPRFSLIRQEVLGPDVMSVWSAPAL